MKKILTGLCAVLLALSATGRLPAQSAEASAPAASSAGGSEPSYCNARIAFGAGIDPATAGGPARTWALALTTLDGGSATGSGTLAIFVGAKRYDVAFIGAKLAGNGQNMLEVATPVVVQFSSPVVVDGGYVNTIAGDSIACTPYAIWTSQEHELEQKAFAKRALAIQPLQAPDPTQWTGACAKPVVGVHRDGAIAPIATAPNGQESGTGAAVVVVAVGADGKVEDARIIGSSGKAWLDHAAVDEAKAAKYNPAQFECKSIESPYIVIVDFEGTQ